MDSSLPPLSPTPESTSATGPFQGAPEPDLTPGLEPISGYRLLSRLGRGGFGEVWSAEAPGGMRVALKFVPPVTRLLDAELRALQAVRDLRHPHLLETHFCIQLPHWLVLCTPLCDGNLAERLRQCLERGLRGVPADELLKYMAEAAEALDFLNAPRVAEGRTARVQHRDIKPHNLLLSGGSVRVGDLGLAKVLERSLGSHSGALTPAYAAPEMFEGRTSAWSDQYSLAVSYCQLRCGQLPFRGGSAELMHGHLHGDPDLSGLADEEKAVVARALSKAPRDRWESCAAFVEQLRGVVGSQGPKRGRLRRRLGTWLGGATYEPPRTRSNRRKGRRALGFGAGLVCLAGMCGLVAFPESIFQGMGYTLKVMGVGLFGGIGVAFVGAGLFNVLTGEDCMGGPK